ncbi:MAG TPA: phosphopyruvate hydratase [Candidatus Cottocaccamicrobium excrementipullorum]|nr:phosphopyruvate hydratase [Candidatus Cottocaccamicrobium excrementipullorum]
MDERYEIAAVHGREILDSRGNPTVEAEVWLECGAMGRAAVPSGASTGQHEAVELRDGDLRFEGKGVQRAVNNINTILAETLMFEDARNQKKIDRLLKEADGTENKEKMGANAILGLSLACARAAAAASGASFYQYVGGIYGNKLPMPMMNILNGGAHSDNSVDIQEFMILPMGASSFKEGMRWCAEVYQVLKRLLKERGLSTAVGDEGGFAPDLSSGEEAIEVILEAVRLGGFRERKDFMISLDAAASEWKNTELGPGFYTLPKARKTYEREQMLEHWIKLADTYPIYSIEDPMDEEDWEGWRLITERIGGRVRLVGDDLFVTNTARLQKGITMHCANAILIKPNQIGTVTETMDAIQLAKLNGYTTIMSHRSGETEDCAIADLAVGMGTELIKTGAPCRGERTAKYNQLLRIEEEIEG